MYRAHLGALIIRRVFYSAGPENSFLNRIIYLIASRIPPGLGKEAEAEASDYIAHDGRKRFEDCEHIS